MTDTKILPNSWSQWPDANGRFGEFGGRYVAETLMPLVLDLEAEYRRAKADPADLLSLAQLQLINDRLPSLAELAIEEGTIKIFSELAKARAWIAE